MIVLGDANLIQRSILVLRDGDKAQHPIALHRQPTVGVVGGAEGAVLRHDRIQRLRLEDAALKGLGRLKRVYAPKMTQFNLIATYRRAAGNVHRRLWIVVRVVRLLRAVVHPAIVHRPHALKASGRKIVVQKKFR